MVYGIEANKFTFDHTVDICTELATGKDMKKKFLRLGRVLEIRMTFIQDFKLILR